MIHKSFQHPSPAKVMGQVLGCDSMEPLHPPFQARMVGVHILGMIDTGQHPNALSQVDRPVGQSHFTGRQGEGPLPSAIGAKDGIQERFQDDFDRLVVVLRENCIGSRSRAVPNGQDRNLLEGEPALRRPTSPVSSNISEDVVVP